MAILYGTLDTGEVLPVQVNNKGQLMAEGLNGSPGEKGDRGEKGDPGQPGADGQDGEGVPKPYGEEGSYLWIKNGVPAWTEGEAPPEPGFGTLVLRDNQQFFSEQYLTGFYDNNTDYSNRNTQLDEFMKLLNVWDNPAQEKMSGLCQYQNDGRGDYQIQFDLNGGQGGICVFYVSYYGFNDYIGQQSRVMKSKCNNDTFAPIQTSFSEIWAGSQRKWFHTEHTWMATRPDQEDVTFSFTIPGLSQWKTCLHKYEVIEPTVFLLRQEIKRLRRQQAILEAKA